jgi:lysozyme
MVENIAEDKLTAASQASQPAAPAAATAAAPVPGPSAADDAAAQALNTPETEAPQVCPNDDPGENGQEIPPKQGKKKKRFHIPAFVWVILAAAALACAAGAEANRLFSVRDIRGIDVSNYQGNISWRAIAENGSAKFVYIKATEGMTYQDPYFTKNWNGAAKYGVTAGAYHFFTLTSTGSEQAQNFISMVPKQKGKLPPAVDIETKIASESQLKSELSDYISAVTKYYGRKPVLYVSSKVYNILYDEYPGYDFWIVDYDGKPAAKGWTFWQYSEKGTSAGIDGKIDLDLYRGSLWNYKKLLSK